MSPSLQLKCFHCLPKPMRAKVVLAGARGTAHRGAHDRYPRQSNAVESTTGLPNLTSEMRAKGFWGRRWRTRVSRTFIFLRGRSSCHAA
jgi:hypothetical protein